MPGADLYIVAAGCGSRMNSELPKALVPIADEPCLTTTLQQIGAKFRKVFVVTNVLACEQWQCYLDTLQEKYPELAQWVVNLPIRSGLGDGHAALQALLAAEGVHGDALAQDIIVTWGDVFFQHAEIIDELLSVPARGPGLFPAVHEAKPYVSLLVNEQMQCMSVSFSKYGEYQVNGLHDQSVFRFARHRLRACLGELHNALWKGGRYVTPGGELSLLYSAHHLYNSGDPIYVYETQYPTLSFNTVEEVAAIQREISTRWQNRFPARRYAAAGV
jgi:bifunctional N-acetylglucosamine-1-phosphate-uridyltransferase/glucosamine-1-phosphate-acetyltransferase GlmU-like protein